MVYGKSARGITPLKRTKLSKKAQERQDLIKKNYMKLIGGDFFQPQMGQFTYWTSTKPIIGAQIKVHVLGSKTLF